MKFTIGCAVAALASAALTFPAYPYCRGCVIETPAAKMALASADANAMPIITPKCHTEKRWRVKDGRKIWRRMEICE